ncbi:MAG: hypothetical protein C5B49_02045 [Bdellovibrio sp.]|nr:MAG: hypothetical protein C5B49_02045 [Bdellovibrio sp.]
MRHLDHFKNGCPAGDFQVFGYYSCHCELQGIFAANFGGSMSYRISRRKFISSTGVVLTLPLLESMFPLSRKLAEAATDPKRYVVYYFPNGTNNRSGEGIWAVPPGPINAATASVALQPFSSLFNQMISFNNLPHSRCNFLAYGSDSRFSGDHPGEIAGYLTCAQNTDPTTWLSFEHAIANAAGKPAIVINGGSGTNQPPDSAYDTNLSFNHAISTNPNGIAGYSTPAQLMSYLATKISPNMNMNTSNGTMGTGGTTGSTGSASNSVSSDKSILDSVIQDLNAYQSTLGSQDKAKMEQYLTTVRNLETNTIGSSGSGTGTGTGTGSPAGSPSCMMPTIPAEAQGTSTTTPTVYLPDFYAFNTLIQAAFACDLTRSVSVCLGSETTERAFDTAVNNSILSGGGSALIYNGQDINNGASSHIGISHGGDGPSGDIHATAPGSQGYNLCATRDRVLLQVPLDLANKLMATTDPSGSTMLSNTIIQAGFGGQDGDHVVFQAQRPLLLIGGSSMTSPGKSYDYTGKNDFMDLYNTIAAKLGYQITGFPTGSATLTF